MIFGLANKPVAPNHLVFIGIVTRKQQNNGEIFVRPQNGFEVQELHDVLINGLQDKQLLVYETATSLWKNKNAIAVTGIAYKSGYPASKTSTGTLGEICIDDASGTLYICTATNTWQKVSLNSANFTNAGGFA
jgi:hypothetical protein